MAVFINARAAEVRAGARRPQFSLAWFTFRCYRLAMKGFPNQVAELSKLAKAIEALVRLADGGEQAKDDGIFGKRSFGRVWRARATRLCPLSDTCEFSG